jgi:hypothetical protein
VVVEVLEVVVEEAVIEEIEITPTGPTGPPDGWTPEPPRESDPSQCLDIHMWDSYGDGESSQQIP